MHLFLTDNQSVCGKRIPPEKLSIIREDVTCGSCTRKYGGSFNARSVANKKARLSEGYNNPQFRGTGAIVCALCDREIRVHPGWPCPWGLNSRG